MQSAQPPHALTEKIWHVAEQRFIDKPTLLSALAQADDLLLGEIHDNRVHHRHQADIIAELARRKKQVQVYFEMISQRQSEDLAAKPYHNLEQLLRRLQATDPAWNYRDMYAPVFEQALQAGYPILYANIDRQRLLDIMKQGDASAPAEVQQLLDAYPLTPAMQQAMADEVVEAHCGMLPRDRTLPMITAQRVRDAFMALRMRQTDTGILNVLITGNGHARKDRGVPMYLSNGQARKTVSVAFMEISDEDGQVEDYKQRWDGGLPFDYVWFTARAQRDDPCDSLKQHLERHKTNPVPTG